MVGYIPKRGDFIHLNFDPQAGHEQKGSRPALVISHSAFNKKMGFVFVCPISNTKRKNPFYVSIPKGKKVTTIMFYLIWAAKEFNPRNYGFSKLGELAVATKLFDVDERVQRDGHSRTIYIRDKRKK